MNEMEWNRTMNNRIPLTLAGFSLLLLHGCTTGTVPIRRLSPLHESAAVAPKSCVLVSIVDGSPAQKAGLREGDTILSVNGTAPTDASLVTDLIASSPDNAELSVLSAGYKTPQNVKVVLNKERPRLGAMCDLTGWHKTGVTPAGNESLTVFNGAYAATFSGIIDKGLFFVRVRLTNNSGKPIEVGPTVLSATDANGQPVSLLTPTQVMCFLYGEKGAHLLALKQKKVKTLDNDTTPGANPPAENLCDALMASKGKGVEAQYIEANAEYVAVESLSATKLAPGATADGLVYLYPPDALPVAFKAFLDGQSIIVRLGTPQPRDTVMKESDLVHFFEQQKKGAALRVTLKKGKVFVGKFGNWDGENERVWFDTPSGRLLNTTSFPLSSIRSAELLEQLPPKPQPAAGPIQAN